MPPTLTILRNEVDIAFVIFALRIPWRRDDQKLRFICPSCKGLDTSVNKKANLGRCFTCSLNYNTIDLVMTFRGDKFRTAVDWLSSVKKLVDTDDGKLILSRQARATMLD
ncbi:MAG: hypothetical protein HQL32_17140 [Planctomycetes bacterium]|nr:hypothetical protein [Planctomycetota bacterium]